MSKKNLKRSRPDAKEEPNAKEEFFQLSDEELSSLSAGRGSSAIGVIGEAKGAGALSDRDTLEVSRLSR